MQSRLLSPSGVDWWRVLRVGLVGAVLVPVLTFGLVVAGPVGTAAAVIKHSGNKGLSFGYDGAIPGNWINCSMQTFYRMDGEHDQAVQTVQIRNGDCATGPAADFQGESLVLTFNGSNQTGDACSLEYRATLGDDEVIPSGATGNGLVGPISVGTATACVISEACWRLGSKPLTGCESHAMGAPTFPTRANEIECDQYKARGIMITAELRDPTGELGYPNNWYPKIVMMGNWKVLHSDNYEVVGMKYAKDPVTGVDTVVGERLISTFDAADGQGLRLGLRVENGKTLEETKQIASDWVNQFKGVQMFNGIRKAAPYTDPRFTPQQSNAGALGLTIPEKCHAYWGPKVANLPNTTIDDPFDVYAPGAVDDPEPVPDNLPPGDGGGDDPEDSCTFVFSDPSTWLEAGMCAAVGLLAEILNAVWDLVTAVGGLAAAIGSAIWAAITWLGDLLAGLFDGILDGLGGILRSLFIPENAPDWGDVPSPLKPGWLPSMPDLGSSPCGSLTFPAVDLGFKGWTVGPVNFANTCQSPWPLVRAFSYNGLLVLVGVGAVWTMFRAATSGLGMGVQTGGGGDDD